ncbi:MAG: protein kinase [Enhygromyxa sp.]
MNIEVATKYKLNDRLERGEVIASRYVVEQLCQNHPLGELYRCRDLSGGALVTLHRLRREFADPEVGDRLFDSRARAALGSSLIPEVLDYGADFDGRPFLVCRFSEATTLADLQRPMSFGEALEIVSQIADALISAHAERLVHGGLDPASVMIAREPGGRARVAGLLGFGLVPALDGRVGKCRALPLLMSPTHVAPELIGGAPITPAADVYALGILLWELIYGAPPFRGPSLRVFDAHQRQALPVLELPFDVPPSFDWVMRRMLAKDPVDRFPDAAAVAEQLRGFASDAIPDLTLELEPDPEPEILAQDEDEDEDERTILFDRRVPEPSSSPSPSRSATAVIVPELAPVPLARPARAKWVAIGTIAAAGMLIVLQALAGTSVEPLGVDAAPELSMPAAVVGAPMVEPQPGPAASNEAPLPPLPDKLAAADFHEHRSSLAASVERHCLGQRLPRSVDVAVAVGASGTVDSATVLGKLASSKVAACVERQSRQLQFPASEEGGYYIYTLRLR